MKVAGCARYGLWGFGDVVCAEEVGEDEECPEEAGYKFIAASGDEYDMVEQFPTAEDYNREITLAYEGDLATAQKPKPPLITPISEYR